MAASQMAVSNAKLLRAAGQDLPASQSIYRADVVPRVFTTIRP